MHRLTLFGGLRIESADGAQPGRASQRRRLALLALLASPPGHRVARDKLITALWPETTDERARRNLSSALYDLRADLGETAILVSGDELTLNTGAVPTDVSVFAAALEAGDLEAATAVYAGPFLDGFFIDDAEDFEHWVEGERQRYARDYEQALLQLAERHNAAGDRAAAAEAWYRLSVADPYSARIAVGYMNALEASGDRARALQFARVHTALLREELGATPSPEVVALAERLRDAPTTAIIDSIPQVTDAPPAAVGREISAPVRVAPEGEDVPTTIPSSPPPGRRAPGSRPHRVRWVVGSAVGMALLIGGGVLLARVTNRVGADPDALEPRTGVAVMPFQNLGGSLEADFGAGLTEEIISGLGKVEALRIPSRTTMILYQDRGSPPWVVGQELGVRYLVEGTVRSEGARLRITASLIEAATGSQIWGDQYDLRMASVFDAQEEIAQAVVRAVAPQLEGTVGPLVESTTRDPEAYRLYMRGRARWYRRGAEDLHAALGFFTQAIQLDPDYALAYSAVADVYNLLGAYDYGLAPPGETFPAARAAAERALGLSPELPQAQAALANVVFNYDWDLDAAERRYRRAIRLNPGYGMTRHWLSLLLVVDGRHEEALREIHAARELDPRSPVLSSSLARHHYYQGAYDRAIEEYHHALELDPSHVLAHLGAGLVWIQLGDYDRALAQYQQAGRIIGTPHPTTLALMGHAEGLAGRTERADAIRRQLADLRTAGTYVAPHYLALVSIGLGDLRGALDLLEESVAERSAAMLYARIDPVVDPLRGEARFQALVRSVVPRESTDPRPGARINGRRHPRSRRPEDRRAGAALLRRRAGPAPRAGKPSRAG
jgi:DNA-binding SARP family transcriptional activator/TolB-like protein/Tfp pilus assembly protein PilF